jgi:hypothetical protein
MPDPTLSVIRHRPRSRISIGLESPKGKVCIVSEHPGARSKNLSSYVCNASKPIGWMAVLAATLIVVVMTFPTSSPIRACELSPFLHSSIVRADLNATKASLSWSPIITLAAIFLSFLTWKFYGGFSSSGGAAVSGSIGIVCIGSSHYSGPIRSITKWSAGAEIDLQSTLKDGAASRRRAEEDIHKFGDSASEIVSHNGIHPD